MANSSSISNVLPSELTAINQVFPARADVQAEKEHVDWLETRLDLMAGIGLRNYQQSMM